MTNYHIVLTDGSEHWRWLDSPPEIGSVWPGHLLGATVVSVEVTNG